MKISSFVRILVVYGGSLLLCLILMFGGDNGGLWSIFSYLFSFGVACCLFGLAYFLKISRNAGILLCIIPLVTGMIVTLITITENRTPSLDFILIIGGTLLLSGLLLLYPTFKSLILDNKR